MHAALRTAFAAIVSTAVFAQPNGPRSPRCFALQYGPWSIGSESLSLHEPVSQGIALLDSVFLPAKNGRPVEYWAVRLPVSPREPRRATWQVSGQDSVVVTLPIWWSTGIQLSLPMSGDTLKGRAEIYVDYSPATAPWASVTATRTKCPSALPIP